LPISSSKSLSTPPVSSVFSSLLLGKNLRGSRARRSGGEEALQWRIGARLGERLELVVVLFVEGGVPGAGRGHGRAEDGVAHAWEEEQGGRSLFILRTLLVVLGGGRRIDSSGWRFDLIFL